LIAVSYTGPAPSREKLAGLTFATVVEKLDTEEVTGPKLAAETVFEHRMNVAFSLLLLVTVIGLWIHFR
jgi:hypothetical protein